MQGVNIAEPRHMSGKHCRLHTRDVRCTKGVPTERKNQEIQGAEVHRRFIQPSELCRGDNLKCIFHLLSVQQKALSMIRPIIWSLAAMWSLWDKSAIRGRNKAVSARNTQTIKNIRAWELYICVPARTHSLRTNTAVQDVPCPIHLKKKTMASLSSSTYVEDWKWAWIFIATTRSGKNEQLCQAQLRFISVSYDRSAWKLYIYPCLEIFFRWTQKYGLGYL